MLQATLSDIDFVRFQRFLFAATGISIADGKKSLVAGRLARRLEHLRLPTYGAYYDLLASGKHPEEEQTAIDLLTTNETYFFREPKHFEILEQLAAAHKGLRSAPATEFRVWSAACSTGEEVYSIAMVLSARLGTLPWSVLGSDISSRVLKRAESGHYRLERTGNVPQDYLKRFCLKGVGRQEGTLLVKRTLRDRVSFTHLNLDQSLPSIGSFDVIFLRNVMIYFNSTTKSEVVARVTQCLRPGGYLFIGHSERLEGERGTLEAFAPAVYRRPEGASKWFSKLHVG